MAGWLSRRNALCPRLVISGTPVQNHLGEMWALFDWALPSLLGDAKFFKNYFERAITAGVDREADVHVRMRGQLVAQVGGIGDRSGAWRVGPAVA